MNHLLASLESSLQSGNHYAALAVALTLPDICGWIEDPTIASKGRCVRWYERYLQRNYVRPATHAVPQHVFLTGNDFYALRCAYLHEGRDEILDQRARQVLDSFQFVVPPMTWRVHMNQHNNTLQLQVDVFCRDVAAGVTQFLADIAGNAAAQQRLSQLVTIKDVNGNPLPIGA